MEETPQGCSGWIEYATDLFDAATIIRLSHHFQTLLQAIAVSPASRLSELPLPAAPRPQPLLSALTPTATLGLGVSSGGRGTPASGPPETACRSLDVGALSPGLLGPERATPALLESPLAPQTEVEKQLARIWSEVLGVEKIGLHDTIFDLGGHSLLITMIIARMRKAFQVDVPIHAFFRTPSLTAIAALIEANLGIKPTNAPKERPQIQRRSPTAASDTQ